ncbi:ATP-binding protein [Velocimicrobium porci]|uniref:Sensor histidine kinase n=1 Tax=Velocimicrobium porci TaxID=2606634 RepID=A0A6L5XXK8_9FIRM|nr:ATP-binding protein [Velocimicrobium porci]MSS62723.1 sensor histidine kinase [Velocimicrobium porci]
MIMNLILEIIGIYIVAAFFHIVFEGKSQSKLKQCGIWLMYFLLQITWKYVGRTPFLNLIYNFFCISFVAFFMYEGKSKRKLIFSLLLCIFWMAVELIIGFGFRILDIDCKEMELIGSICSKFCMILFIKILSKYFRKKRHYDISLRQWVGLVAVPMNGIFIIHTIFLLNRDNASYFSIIMSIISCIMILISNLILLKIYDKLAEDLEVKRANLLYSQQLTLYKRHSLEREETMLRFRAIRHDMKNHFIYMHELLEQKKYNRLQNYIERIMQMDEYFKYEICKSGNILIDSLINYKYEIAQKNEIPFELQIEVFNQLPFEDGDICIILGNALDNAMEAVYKVVNTEERFIKISILFRKNVLMLSIRNSYNGEIKETKEGSLITEKKDYKNHGIGIPSMKRVVSKYNGEFMYQYDEHVFELNILLYVPEEKLLVHP